MDEHLNSERYSIEDESVGAAPNSVYFVEPRRLRRAGASICVNENLVNRSSLVKFLHAYCEGATARAPT